MFRKQSGWWSSVLVSLLLPVAALGASPRAASNATPSVAAKTEAEPWKGKSDSHQFGAGALAGLGIANGSAGFSLLGTASHRILPEGFIPDINDAGWIEVELGPTFFKGGNAFFYSVHLRWDFIKDDAWTFYSLGGLGGFITDSSLGGSFELFPRFGAGALWKISSAVQLRGEVSHELVGVGVQFPL